MKITYGIDVVGADDPYITIAEEAMRSVEFLVEGSSLLEYFPFLARMPKWLPGTQVLTHLEEASRAIMKFREMAWIDGKKRLVSVLALAALAPCQISDARVQFVGSRRRLCQHVAFNARAALALRERCYSRRRRNGKDLYIDDVLR